MTSIPSFEKVVIYNDNNQNGALSTYTFEMIPRVNFYNGDFILLSFPPELSLPSSPVCEGGSTLMTTLVCSSPTPNLLKLDLAVKTADLADSFRISFRVFNVRNSANTKQTEPFTDIEARDSLGRKISMYS